MIISASELVNQESKHGLEHGLVCALRLDAKGVEESEHSERHALLVLRILGYLSRSFGKPAVSDGGKTIIAQDPASEFLTWRE